MDTYSADVSPLWDLSQASSFSQLPDDDFLALLQKQFPSSPQYTADFTMGVNPLTISRYPLPSLTPPSEDSSPSPPQQSGSKSPEDEHDLKRKASDEDFDDEGPSQKSQHLSNGKKGASRRKSSSGNTNPDETRLMKRKEQNRAAQRAFRERKEKHVKDLEDKVAALEAKNDAANSENENLRDLLSRLQNENVMLKESTFTFSVPKTAASASAPIPPVRSPTASLPASSPTPNSANPLDYSSLMSFDPSMLSLLDDTPQQTATDGAMQMDFGFGQNSGFSANKPQFTTIASNPMFTSFAASFDASPYSPPAPRPAETTASPFNFDINSLSAWSTPNPDNGAFDDLFGGFMGGNSFDVNDFNVLMSNSPGSSISPVAHHATLNNMAGRSPANSTTSSSSKSSDPLFNTPRESSGSESDPEGETKECPTTKEALRSHISEAGPSAFATDAPSVRKADSIFGPAVMCEGSAFPQTQQSEKNMEILTAWRTVTSDPKFKTPQDSDLADLCSEFSAKARCDGTKVVLEPQGVRNIIESLGMKHNRK
ncbi:hypothetical protein B0H19DRAFT_1024730 [Mycena capillaripes]|nr:hypothetical protein B0H19DRAFT_1024730 [Mycena capillaripes]